MFFQRKPGKVVERVCVYYFKDNKQVALPRKLTKHLDGKADWEIEDWLRWYEAVHKLPRRKTYLELGDCEKLLGMFLKHLELQKLNRGTIRIYEASLRMALPHFIPEENFDSWYLRTGQLYDYLGTLAISAEQHNRTNQSFSAFYRWLQLQGIVKHRHGLMLMNRPSERSKTPLKRVLKPSDVLTWVKAQTQPDLQFMALAGFFFSLRTGETFGMRKADMLAGARARSFEAAKVLAKADMPCSLVVNVQNCRRPNGSFYTPTELKRGGIVGCFDRAAAEMLVKLVNKRPDNLIINERIPEYWMKLWGKKGMPGITLKDLRRASLYWLGHYSNLSLVGLQNHARHTDPKTTALYYRRPEEEFDGNEGNLLDLEA